VSARVVLCVVLAACGRVAFDERPPDAGELPSCDNVKQDGDETGIDCGGSCGRACVGETCGADADCVTGHCLGVCELASGPPGWQAAPSLSAVRTNAMAATESTGAIYIVGGSPTASATPGALSTTEFLAWGATGWAAGPSLITGRYSHGVGALDGVIYAYGGRDNAEGSVTTVEILDTGLGWSARDVGQSHASIAFVGANDGRLYMLDFSLRLYTPATNAFVLGPPTTVLRDALAGALGRDGRVYEIGGQEMVSNNRVSNVDALDTDTQVWEPRAPLSMPRNRLGAAAAPDGRIYAVGGEILGMGAVDVVEAFDVEGNRWISMPPLSVERARPGVAVGGDGRVYAIGGEASATVVHASVEAYGPIIAVTDTARAGDTLAVTASNFARNATLVVRVDDVLVATGTTDGTGSALVEIIVPALPAGFHVVSAIDQRSQYRVQQPLTIE